MAEINIEPKKRSGWSWIIVLLILALVGWLIYRYFYEPAEDTVEPVNIRTTGMVMPVPPAFYTT